ncbi:MAG TPA: type II toxin-antitoxin system RelE/ParE family toxin [Candidatus Methylacidiphilales bacterium]|jgi:plasmid stabilization system protein ParE|nr:type II toxin-antitoxin system RelE/ParE family toxin [Candidatus Methylacidiphilales bacterium]
MNSTNKRQKPEIHPAADADIDRQYEWLQNHYCSAETLHKFLDAIEEAKAKIGDNPETWSKVSGSNKVRKVQIKSFRMTAFYVIRKSKVPLILEFAGPGLMPRWADRL